METSTIIKFSFKIIFASFLAGSSTQLAAQAWENQHTRQPLEPVKPDKKFNLDRIVVGGSVGAQFGTITSVQLAPTVGYLFTDHFLAGIAGKFIYFEQKYFNFTYKTIMYGGGFYAQYFFLENFLVHAEYELLNLEAYYQTDNSTKRVNVSSIFLGGGYRSSLGGISYASIMLLYNINDDINSPYSNPILRISFGIGL